MLGHTFNESENQPGQDGVVPLGYGLWKTRFGDASVLAKTLELSGRVLPVIGVMPPEFVYPPGAVMWSPVVLDDATRARRDFHRLRVIAHLKDGLSLNRASSDYKDYRRTPGAPVSRPRQRRIRGRESDARRYGRANSARLDDVTRSRRIRTADRVRQCGQSVAG
jgi:hypothetical protein